MQTSFEDQFLADDANQTAAGHRGVLLIGSEGELFFGQNPIRPLNWRMEQKGLQKR